MPHLFDVIIILDWSASATPKTGADSIWCAESDVLSPATPALCNLPTRTLAAGHLGARLRHHAGRRVLVGCDFAFGYPAGFARRAGLVDAASPIAAWEASWRHLAATVTDDARNRNNRWAVAAALNQRLGANHFWGVPAARATEWLPTRKPRGPALHAFRGSEVHLLAQTGRRPFSVWQLLGAGAVGSQTLMGIPVLQSVRTAAGLAERMRVWPFETGFTTDPCHGRSDAIVLAEVWPSALDVGHVDHPVKDARQVLALAGHFAAADAAGVLAGWFHPTLPPDAATAAVAEEGWVLHG